MTRPELADVLTALVTAVQEPQDTGLSVQEVIIDIPLEGHVTREEGRTVVRASPPHSRFVSGVLPPVHRARLHLVRSVGEDVK